MKPHTTIAVIGGTGKSGQYLIKALLQQNFAIRLLVRTPYIIDPAIHIIAGDAGEADKVKTLVTGADALISTIGQRGNDLPVFSTATANVIQTHIQRYIVTTGLSVQTPQDQKSPWVRQATDWMYSHYPATTGDKQREYELLQESTLNWTMVRLPLIELTDDHTDIRVSLTDCPSDKISATSLADFLVKQLSDQTYHRAAPFIGNVL